jgi:hypothetical protein
VRDFAAARTDLISVAQSGDSSGNTHSASPALSGDGRVMAFESWATDLVVGDTNGLSDIFVHQLPVVAGVGSGAEPHAALEYVRLAPNPARAGAGADVRFPLSEPARVRVSVYDAQGRLVLVLGDAELPPGSHARRWDGRQEHGAHAAAGLYFVRVETGGRSVVSKLVALP